MNKLSEIITSIKTFNNEPVELYCTFAQYTDESIFLVENIESDAEENFKKGKALKVVTNERLLDELSEQVARGSLASVYEIVEECTVKGILNGIELTPMYIQLPNNSDGVYEYNART